MAWRLRPPESHVERRDPIGGYGHIGHCVFVVSAGQRVALTSNCLMPC
ncbi:gp238 [Mycobacterium phage Omega]|uniref:Uncharacterized protein n=1 Tax=Mycobacterium phage Omega TaxID=2907835 RepID=Q853S9_BPMOM|nr:gp238 [Mycobacterium phage Omega]AAN12879.1 hypothetical protein PBI_OMEGA_238 [Mycobacterium phage Omega]